MSGSSSRVLKRGDIVWARVHFPHTWFPALVLSSSSSSDDLGISVSFFNSQNDTNISRTYFLQSELLPFEDAFPSLISRRQNDTFQSETFRALLHSALRLFGLRVVSSLRCRCQTGQEEHIRVYDGSGCNLFDPNGVLGFVLDAAVLPSVEASSLVDAVRVVAQLHAFRNFSSIHQKKVYRQTPKLGDNVKQLPCSSLSQKIPSVTQKSMALEPEEKYQIISNEQGEENVAISAIRRLKSAATVLERNSEQLFQNKLLIIPEAPTTDGNTELLMRSPALGPFYIGGESLKLESQSLLRFKNILDHGIVDICFANCSMMSDNVKQLPCSSLSQKIHSDTQESMALEPEEKHQIISNEQGEENMAIGAIRRLKSTVPVLKGNSEQLFQNKLLIIPEAPTPNGKAELLMRSPALGPFYIGGESLKLERHSLLRFKDISHHGIVDICFGNYSMMRKTQFSISSNFKSHLSSYISKRKDNTLGLCCRLPDIETTICLNRKRKRLDKNALCHVFPQTSNVQESEGNAYISKYTRPRISHIKMLETEEGILKDNQACIHFCENNINFTDEVQNVDLKRSQNLTLQQSSTCESSSNLAFGFHSDNNEVDASAAKVKFVLGSCPSVYQKRLQRSCNGDITPLKSKESARTKLSSGDCYQYVASCSTLNSKVGQQSKTHVPFPSRSLYMKFPKNFNLPSKGQLIKKFSVFGSVDSSRTRVFWYTGSAQVAFFQEGDTVAAYQYAKRKMWFGEANVRFWLDPYYEHKRSEFNHFSLRPPSASKPIGPPLKSCLKKSNSLKQENRKKPYRVRFTIET